MLKNLQCQHWLARHTVWYLLDDGSDDPIPYSFVFNNQKDAVVWAERMTHDPTVYLRWIKIAKATTPVYPCWQWSNPLPMPPSAKAKLESESFWRRMLKRRIK